MAWKVKTKMEQKVEFIYEWLTQQYSITELCRSFEISRPTAYKLISRYERMGISGLVELKKAPINHPNRTKEKVEESILEKDGKVIFGKADFYRIRWMKSTYCTQHVILN